MTGPNDNPKTIADTNPLDISNGHPVSVTITDVSKRELGLKKRQIDCSKDGEMAKIIYVSEIEALYLASLAIKYIDKKVPDDNLYKDYFGDNSPRTVIDNFNLIKKGDSEATLTCMDPRQVCSELASLAYYMRTVSGTDIFYCDGLHNQVPLFDLCTGGTTVNARKTRGGTTIRALAVAFIPDAIFNTKEPNDGMKSCEDGKKLSNPDKIKSSDNYEVSFTTPCGIPRARALTGVVSALLPRSISPSATTNRSRIMITTR